MTMCSRFLRHWYVNNFFNDATAWMDNEMSCDLTSDLVAHLSRSGSSVHVTCRKKLRTTQGDKQIRATTASGLCFDKHNNTLDQSA